MLRLTIDDPASMHALGVRLGQVLGPGDMLALMGDLGAGKTVLTQGIASGLALPEGTPVVSPTFTLVNEHHGGRLPLVHADLYRLEEAQELAQIGLLDRYGGPEVVVVEWADRFAGELPADRVDVRIIAPTGGDPERAPRVVEITGHGAGARTAAALAQTLGLEEGAR